MAVLIDTGLLIDLKRGVGSPTVEVSEMLHGVHRASGATRARRSAFVEHHLAGLRAVPITDLVARVHAELWAQLSARRTPIGPHDLWIGATAVAHGLGVVTGNAADFGRIPGLRVITPPA